MNRTGKIIVVVALVLVAVSAYTSYRGTQGFNPAEIDDIKKKITDDFTAKGMTVTEVSMLRRTPRDLGGYVKFKAPGSDQMQQKACTALMGSDQATSWTCN
ncbi:MAG: hypothetical protein J0G36_05465 [Afipia sp.]|nr:hypothetical protein [Afipia sp.]